MCALGMDTDGQAPGQGDDQGELQLALSGDLHAFEQLVRRHEERVFSFLARWLGDRAAAEDVLQEAVIQAFRNLSKFTPGMPFRPWFFRIAINAAKSYLRARSRSVRRTDAFAELATNPVNRPTITAQLRAVASLQLGLEALSQSDRQLLLLHYAEEMSLKEMSEVLHAPEIVLKMRLHRARNRFRRAVEDAERREA